MMERKRHYVFVTGGVISSLGKGIVSASIGCILERRGLRVAIQKIDPYLNVDPGTMSPFQHGEVFVTDDGAETDLDLGHYERFTSARMNRTNNFTAGRIYQSIIEKERRGDFLGGTVQVIPHVTDEIKHFIKQSAEATDVDVLVVELGGTVGDIESLPFLEAIRQFRTDADTARRCVYVHVSLLPYVETAGEVKTKPTQHSVARLREIGIQPDVIVCRSSERTSFDTLRKISLFCNVRLEAVVQSPDLDFIYEVPLVLHEQKMDQIIVDALGLDVPPADLDDWRDMVYALKNPSRTVSIAVVGKYVRLRDAYKSITEALLHGGIANDARVEIEWVEAEDLEKPESVEELLGGVSGILVPGGFGERGVEGKIRAVEYARSNRVPFLGICLGMQCAVIEFARNVCGLKDAGSSEFQPDTPHPVIHLLPEQEGVEQMGGTMRLGAYPCRLARGTVSFEAYGEELIHERHRHRYEFNNAYRDVLSSTGLRVAGVCPGRDLVEIVEVEGHPWFVGCQFHPEFKSRPMEPHPLFVGFVRAALERSGG